MSLKDADQTSLELELFREFKHVPAENQNILDMFSDALENDEEIIINGVVLNKQDIRCK